MHKTPLVSVVIPTSNSGATIERCLSSIKNQTFSEIEMIVVDKYSSDNTRDIGKEFDAEVIDSEAGRSAARNVGANRARGKYIVFLDSDMELSPNAIKECLGKATEGYDALIIPELSAGEGFWADCRAIEKLCYIGDDLVESARFFRKDTFEKAGGFDLQLVAGEDWDLTQRMKKKGFKIGRIGSSSTHLEGKLSLVAALRKKYEYGNTLEKFLDKHPIEGRRHFALFRPAYIRNWRILIRNPVHTLGLVFLKSCEFLAGGLGFLQNKLRGHWSEKYEKWTVQTTPNDLAKIKIIEETLRSTPKKHKTILDLGCGVGSCTSSLSRFGTVIALEISKNKLETAKINYGQGSFVLGDAQCLPFRRNCFDVVVIKDVLEHIMDDERVISEVAQVSKNGSSIILYVPVSLKEATLSIEALIERLIGYSIDPEVGHVRRYSVPSIDNILRMKGFGIIVNRYYAHLVVGLLTVLLVTANKKLVKERLASIQLFPRAFYSVLVPLCKLEYRILNGYPGAGLFVFASKLTSC